MIKTYKKETGFTANFCTNCGSTLPNHVPSLALMWIPLGALDNEITPKNRLSFHIQSKALWSETMSVQQEYLALPSKDDLEKIFPS